MVAWAMQHLLWFAIRVIVSLACIWTIQNIIYLEGYLIEFKVLLVCAVCLVVAVRMWMPPCKEVDDKKETTWSYNE